jgi:hypothetical protein
MDLNDRGDLAHAVASPGQSFSFLLMLHTRFSVPNTFWLWL